MRCSLVRDPKHPLWSWRTSPLNHSASSIAGSHVATKLIRLQDFRKVACASTSRLFGQWCLLGLYESMPRRRRASWEVSSTHLVSVQYFFTNKCSKMHCSHRRRKNNKSIQLMPARQNLLQASHQHGVRLHDETHCLCRKSFPRLCMLLCLWLCKGWFQETDAWHRIGYVFIRSSSECI